MNSVFVLSSTKKPLTPCRPVRARRLLRRERAASIATPTATPKAYRSKSSTSLRARAAAAIGRRFRFTMIFPLLWFLQTSRSGLAALG